jgi:trimeric autotransporter adhesin
MATFFRSKVDALRVDKTSDGTLNYYIGDTTIVSATTVGNGNYIFDPKLGKAFTVTANAYVDVTEALTSGTVTDSTLRWNGTAWVENTELLATSAGIVTASTSVTAGKAGTATGSLILKGTTSGTGTLSTDATVTKITSDKPLDVTGTVTASTGVTATTGGVTASAGDVTATLGNIVASAGSVSANTTVTAGTGVTATTGNILASAGNVTAGGGTITAGTTATTAGTLVIYATGGAAGVELSSTAGDTLKVGNGSNDGIIDNLADPTTANQGANKQYVDAEDGFLRTYTGKSAAGSENPTYSSTNYVTQSTSLESAIGELDGDVFTAISALSSGVAWKGVAEVLSVSGATSGDATYDFAAVSTADITMTATVSYGSQVVNVGGAITGGDATGLANDATVYTASISVGGTSYPIAVTGSAAQTYTTLLSEINTDLGVAATAAIVSGNVKITANATQQNIVITDTDLFSTLSDYVSISAAVDFSAVYFTDDDTPVQLSIIPGNFPANTYIIVDNNTYKRLWKSDGTKFIYQASLAATDTYGVKYDLTSTYDPTERSAIYTYTSTPDWVKIGEFAIGQIENGSIDNSLPVWSNTNNTWKQFEGASLFGDGSTKVLGVGDGVIGYSGVTLGASTQGFIATHGTTTTLNGVALGTNTDSKQMTVASGQTSGTGNTGPLALVSGSASGSGDTGAAILKSGNSTSGVTGGVDISTGTTSGTRGSITLQGNGISLDGLGSNSVTLPTANTDQETGASTEAVATTAFIREKVVLRKTGTTSVSLSVGAKSAKFMLLVTNATGSYSSEGMVVGVGTQATPVQGTDYDITETNIVSIGSSLPTSITLAVTDVTSSVATLTVTATGSTLIVVEAIPLV